MAETTEVLPSAARTADATVNVDVPFGKTAVLVVVDATDSAATPSVVPKINGLTKSGATYTLLDGVAVTGTSSQALTIGPGLPATANVSANTLLPETIQVFMDAADTDSLTYSVNAYFS